MIFGSVTLFIIGIILLIFSILFFKGKTDLLHDYHRSNVDPKDNKKLGIGVGIGMLIGALGMIADGILFLISGDELNTTLFLLILFGSEILNIIISIKTIVKYNGKFID